MKNIFVRRTLFNLIAVSLVSMGFLQSSGAAVISTGEYIDVQSRGDRLERVEAFLARQEVAKKLELLGVPAHEVQDRVRNMSDAELVELDGTIESHVAGGDALGTIGLVFLILIILELGGVTEIFKSI
jgi:hypothetical protein